MCIIKARTESREDRYFLCWKITSVSKLNREMIKNGIYNMEKTTLYHCTVLKGVHE